MKNEGNIHLLYPTTTKKCDDGTVSFQILIVFFTFMLALSC